MLSQRVLIGRGLDLEKNRDVESKISSLSERLLFGFEDTLESIFEKAVLKRKRDKDGVDGGEDPPVPIPNTEVKLTSVENTWLETAWEDR